MGPFHLSCSTPSGEIRRDDTWTTLHEFMDGAPFVTVKHDGDSYRVRVHAIGDFVIRRGETEVHVETSVALAEVQQAFSDFVLPAAYQLLGVLAFHASATRLGDRVVGFLGTSGRGKSTLAAAFASRGEVFSDDCLAVDVDGDSPWAHPEGVTPQLRPASARRFVPGGVAAGEKTPFVTDLARSPARLSALYVLETGSGCESTAVKRSEAMMLLASHLYRVDWVTRDLLRNELERLERLVRVVPVRRLVYERTFEVFPRLVELVVDEVVGAGISS